MGFFFLAIYYAAVLIRPQEWAFLPLLYDTRLMFYSLLFTLVGWLFSESKFSIPIQTKLLIGMLFVILISSALNGWLGGGVLYYFPRFAKTAVIPFTLIATLVNTRFKLKCFMFITVVSGVIMATNGISQHLNNGIGWAGSEFSRRSTRITYLGTFNDPNDLGMLFVMVIPMITYFFYRGGAFVKLIMIATFCVIVQGIFLTDSRGTLLGFLVVCGLWFLQKYSVTFTIITSVLTIPAVMFLISKFREFDPNEGSAEGRWDAWYTGFDFLRNNPLFGIGYRQFVEEHTLTAHNSFVLVFSELGLTGYFFWFSFLALTMLMLYSVMTYKVPFFNKKKLNIPLKNVKEKFSEIDDEILLAKVLFFSMVGFVATGFFLSRCYMFLMYLFAGMAVASYSRSQRVITDLQPITFENSVSLLIRMMLFSLVAIYLFTRVMLHWQG